MSMVPGEVMRIVYNGDLSRVVECSYLNSLLKILYLGQLISCTSDCPEGDFIVSSWCWNSEFKPLWMWAAARHLSGLISSFVTHHFMQLIQMGGSVRLTRSLTSLRGVACHLYKVMWNYYLLWLLKSCPSLNKNTFKIIFHISCSMHWMDTSHK
jgi:hypothetical protein